MPNFNARIRERDTNSDGKANIKIRITHAGESRYIRTEFYIEPKHFDNKAGRVKPSHPNAADTNINLQALELSYSRKILKIEGRIKSISINDIVDYIHQTDNYGSLNIIPIARQRAEAMRSAGRLNSARILENTISHLIKYNGSDTLPFTRVNSSFLKGFESTMNATGTQNGAAIHLRNIRAIFNLAIDEHNLSPEYYPFRKFKIKTKQTIHRDLTPEELRELARYKPKTKFEETAIDLFFLSFYLVGANFKDILSAKSDAIQKGRFIYNRAKTSTIYSIRIEPEAKQIIDKYRGKKYVLKFIEEKTQSQAKKDRKSDLYKDITDRVNRTLKKITKSINEAENGAKIEPMLSTYFARHSWGTIASRIGTSHDVIREALGHSRTVTDTYINFYTKQIDEANRRVINEVFKSDQPAG